MSVAMSISYAVPERSLIVFLVSAVVIASFIMTNVLVPILTPEQKHSPSEHIGRLLTAYSPTSMLAGHRNNRVKLVRARLEFVHERAHLDRLRARSENEHHFLARIPLPSKSIS